ncbi:hypothetical protein GCM10009716_34100 [Streptomyces sodiiphilus]|uniref:ABC transporter permease n=1 Tax=Streptomyces sodiiphilus TaxID=226217 RepID=A0ABN2PIJ3_9ACTN
MSGDGTGPAGNPVLRVRGLTRTFGSVVLPWPVLGLLVLGLPVLAGVVAALPARSRPDLARRSG